jgi:hypothetical protein
MVVFLLPLSMKCNIVSQGHLRRTQAKFSTPFLIHQLPRIVDTARGESSEPLSARLLKFWQDAQAVMIKEMAKCHSSTL